MIQKFLSIWNDSPNSFEGQSPDEKVFLVLRRHRFTLYTKLTISVLALLAPIFIGLIFFSMLKAGGFMTAFILISAIWYTGFWIAIFYTLTMHALNVVLITNRRIIDNDQFGLWQRKVSELHVSRIQDVSVSVKGFIQTTFRFGNINIQTASGEKQFIFPDIPEPDRVKDVVMSLIATQTHGVQAL